jgi:tRNA threonylcarbamoyladenosine biosynthesis protein TsaB
MILAIDTATRATSVALHDGHQVTAEMTWLTENYHTVELAPTVAGLLDRVGVRPADLAAIALAKGPGSFTGLRIGMSFAKGLALSSSPPLPLIGVPTLDIITVAQPRVLGRLCAVAQAGRGRVNAGFYRQGPEGWEAEGDPVIVNWDDLLPLLEGPTQVCGEIDRAGYERLQTLGDRVMIASPAASLRRAGFLAELARRRLALGAVDEAATLAPLYLH